MDGCVVWMGDKSKGHGQLEVDGQFWRAHRLAYEVFVGPIPDGHTIDHICHNLAVMMGTCAGGECHHRACIRPDHLVPKPQGANLLASPLTQASINKSKTHCKRHHEFTPENTRVKDNGWRSCKTCDRMTPDERRVWDEGAN